LLCCMMTNVEGVELESMDKAIAIGNVVSRT